jgi:hypothetical protein
MGYDKEREGRGSVEQSIGIFVVYMSISGSGKVNEMAWEGEWNWQAWGVRVRENGARAKSELGFSIQGVEGLSCGSKSEEIGC